MIKSTPQRLSVSIEVMAALLTAYTDSPVTIRELSKTTVSVSYLEQVFALLRRAELISARAS